DERLPVFPARPRERRVLHVRPGRRERGLEHFVVFRDLVIEFDLLSFDSYFSHYFFAPFVLDLDLAAGFFAAGAFFVDEAFAGALARDSISLRICSRVTDGRLRRISASPLSSATYGVPSPARTE